MAEFADLTNFIYTDSQWAFSSGQSFILLNVGWLGSEVSKVDGQWDADSKKSFLYHIREFAKHPVNLYRGVHQCEICGYNPLSDDLSDGGNGEIWVRGVNNLVYVAPTLIIHYVDKHDYLPPSEYVDRVINVSSVDAYSEFKDMKNAAQQ